MQKTGQVDRTIDREFAEEEGRYRTMEKETNALQKDAKTYLDAMRGELRRAQESVRQS
jgi:amphiphysin